MLFAVARRPSSFYAKTRVTYVIAHGLETDFSPNKALGAEGFLFSFYRIALLFQVLPLLSDAVRRLSLAASANSYFFWFCRRRPSPSVA